MTVLTLVFATMEHVTARQATLVWTVRVDLAPTIAQDMVIVSAPTVCVRWAGLDLTAH